MSRIPAVRPPQIEGFRYRAVLGKGGFADVFTYQQFDRIVAVKVLHDKLLDRRRRQAFADEAAIMSRLSSHPHVVGIHVAGVTADGVAYLVMEYCPPPHLGDQIKQATRPTPLARALEIGIQIAGAVESAHRQGVLHRDIKPANILFTEFGPKLSDFGISTFTEDSGDGPEGLSIPWAPPEQITGARTMDRTSDVYSLAATIWTMLAGRSPFELPGGPNDAFSLSRRVREEPPPWIGRAEVPESLERVLGVAMAKDQQLRYQSAEDFARALQAIQAELHLSTTTLDIVADRPEDIAAELDAGDGATRVTGFRPIDPDGDPIGTTGERSHSGLASSGVTQSRPRGESVGRLDTEPRPAVAAESTDPARPQRRLLPLAAALAVVAVAAGGGYAALHSSSGSSDGATTTTSEPLDPAGVLVRPVEEVRIARSGNRITVTWRNPEPKAGDTYSIQVIPPDKVTDNIHVESFSDIAPVGACVYVVLHRSNGAFSERSRQCEKS